jgi:hypothetical protein
VLVSAMGEDGELEPPEGGPIFLAPGAAGAVVLRPGIAGFGSWSKIYKVLSNDPEQGSSRISLSAEIRPRFLVEPRRIDLGEISADLDTLIRVSILAASEDEFEILGAEHAPADPRSRGPRALLEVNPGRTEGKERAWFLDLRFRPGPAVGEILEKVRLRTTDPLVSLIELAVEATVSPEIRYPDLFEMTERRGAFEIRRLRGLPLHITGISLNHPQLRAELEILDAGEAYRVRLERLPSAPPEMLLPWLLVKTDRPDEPLLRIKIRSLPPDGS